MSQPLHTLIVEDSEDDLLFVVQALRQGGYDVTCKRVDTEAGFNRALAAGGWDLIIADYHLPKFGAMAALDLLHASGADLPFIIVSGAIGEETAVAAMKLGAHDYILKHSLKRLAPAVARELREAQMRRERRQAAEELLSSREQLRALAAHLQSVREEERKRITREIHDELGQALTGIKMDLAWIRNRVQGKDAAASRQLIVEKIGAMGALLDETSGLVRRLCTELRPGILDDLGLTAAIEWQAQEYQNRTGIPCHVAIELGDVEVGADMSTALFRIFQEILTNVARHARANRVEARLELVGGKIVLEVRDNGKGIKESEKSGKKSLGLVGMRERALIMGGEVEIHGEPGKGTTVRAIIPLTIANPNMVTSGREAAVADAKRAAAAEGS